MVLLIYTAALYFGLWLRISLKNEVNEKIVVSQSRDQTHKSRVLLSHVFCSITCYVYSQRVIHFFSFINFPKKKKKALQEKKRRKHNVYRSIYFVRTFLSLFWTQFCYTIYILLYGTQIDGLVLR